MHKQDREKIVYKVNDNTGDDATRAYRRVGQRQSRREGVEEGKHRCVGKSEVQ